MTTLIIEHQGWTVVTDNWTAAAKPGKNVQIVYDWGPVGGISFFQGATGTQRTTLSVNMTEFIVRTQGGGMVDLRKFSTE